MGEKVKKHGIGGKIGRWIMEFLNGRKFRVVANGYMSREEDVISGVPQGTVLAAILFVIMISAIDDWAEKNKMKFNENKFEQMAHGLVNEVTIDPYKNSNGEEIEIKETAKNLGVMATNDLMFF